MDEPFATSPRAIFVRHARRQELAYQVSSADGAVVFYPRVIAPKSGSRNLEWRVSKGPGVVYATTTVTMKGDPPYNIALVDLDEGFRMLARVEGISPDAATIGMRVRAEFLTGDGNEPYPVFVPLGAVR